MKKPPQRFSSKSNSRPTPPLAIFLFGEAKRGEFCTPKLCRSLAQLYDLFGEAPEESLGIFLATQALLYKRSLYFCRVGQEGFSKEDYLGGLKFLEKSNLPKDLSAICLPGVGCPEILGATHALCNTHKILILINPDDLYDYLTFGTHSQEK